MHPFFKCKYVLEKRSQCLVIIKSHCAVNSLHRKVDLMIIFTKKQNLVPGKSNKIQL